MLLNSELGCKRSKPAWYYLCVFKALNALIALFKKTQSKLRKCVCVVDCVQYTSKLQPHVFAFDLSMLPDYSTTCIMSEPWCSPFAFSLMMTLPIGLYNGVAR